MNQMLKKASSVCAAAVCAASLMFSGASVVMAGSEIDEEIMTQITMTAEGLTQTIIPLSDEEIEAYLESGDEFTEGAMTAWDDARDEVGELKEAGKAEVEFSNHQYTATVPVDFEKLDAKFEYVFEDVEGVLTPVSASVDVQYPLSTTMKNAGLNTVMGLGTVFVILVLLIFIISLFKFIPGSPASDCYITSDWNRICDPGSSDLYYFSFQIYSGFTGSCKKREKRRSSGTGTCRCSGSGNSAGS